MYLKSCAIGLLVSLTLIITHIVFDPMSQQVFASDGIPDQPEKPPEEPPEDPPDDDDDDEDGDDDEEDCEKDEDPKGGKSINFYTGYEEYITTDMVVNGVYDIRMRRHYLSQSSYDSPLGYGWGFNYDQRLYKYPDNSIVIRFDCGRRMKFVSSGGAFVPDPRVKSTLVEQPDSSYVLKSKSGKQSIFDLSGRLVALQDKTGNRLEMTYDTTGKIEMVGSSPYALNPEVPAPVSRDHRLTKVEERLADGTLSGNYIEIIHNPSTGRVGSIRASDGREVTYQHDTSNSEKYGNLTSVIGLDGYTSTFEYNNWYDKHYVTSFELGAGSTPYVNTYDTLGRVVRQTHGLDTLVFNYVIPRLETNVRHIIKDSSGTILNDYTMEYEFNEFGKSTKRVDGLGNELRRTYDANQNVTRKEIWQNNSGELTLYQAVDYTYDAQSNKLTETVVLDGGEIITKTWTYDHDFVASEEIVSSLEPTKTFRTETEWFHNVDGFPTSIKEVRRIKADGSAQTTAYTYDDQGRVETTTLPDGVQMVNEYTGNFLSKTYYKVNGAAIPQLEQRFEYDSRGDLRKTWDANNNLTQMDYDDQGRIIKETNALNQETIYTYTQDLLTQVERGRVDATEGQITKPIYNSEKRLIEKQRKNDIGAFETHSTFTYDSAGNMLSETDAIDRTTTYEYDKLNRLVKISDNSNNETQVIYDVVGNKVGVIDQLTNETRYVYDYLNRLVKTEQLGLSSAPVTEYTYDAVGNLISVKDAEESTTRYEYDLFSRKTKEIFPLGQHIDYAYDDRDRLSQLINANGQKIEYQYYSWGGIEQEQWFADATSNAPFRTISVAYDYNGNLASISDDGIQSGELYTQTWDALNRPDVKTIKYLPGSDRVLDTDYDALGNISQFVFDDDGQIFTQSHQYNSLNRLSGATLPNSQVYGFSYYDNDDLKQITHPNGLTTDYSYQGNGPVAGIHVNDGVSAVQTLDYTYDAVLNIDTQTDNAGFHDFNYDGIYRLTESIRPSTLNTLLGIPDESFDYDLVGNRVESGGDTGFSYDGNHRMGQATGLTYTYDDAGNTKTRSDGVSIAYDHRNRMTQYSQGANTANYEYTPDNLRLKKTVDGVTTWFLYTNGQLLAEYDSSGTRTKRYAYLPGSYLATQLEDANGVYEVHGDHIQMPRVLTDVNQEVVWESVHEAFGRAYITDDVDGDNNAVEFNQGFPGQYRDGESGLVYNWNRYYDPVTGRYITSDPIGSLGLVSLLGIERIKAADLNLYGYVIANPMTWLDPYGLAEICNTSPFQRPPRMFHTLICVGNECSGKHAAGSPLGGPGEILNDSGDKPGASCRDIPKHRCTQEQLDDCMLDRIRNDRGSSGHWYDFPGDICGNYATQTIDDCRQKCVTP